MLMVSFGALFFALDSWGRYSFVLEQVEILSPSNNKKYLDALEGIKSAEEAKSFAENIINSISEELETKHKLAFDVASGAEQRFFAFSIIYGLFAFLTLLLTIGLSPQFKKSANKAS